MKLQSFISKNKDEISCKEDNNFTIQGTINEKYPNR